MSRTIRRYEGWGNKGVRKQRDKKPWFKPNGEFKKVRRRQDRAFERQQIREHRENIVERRKRDDVWDWN